MQFSKLARLGNDLLSRHQNGLAVAALVVAACPTALMLVLAFTSICSPGDTAPPAIAWEGKAPAAKSSPSIYRVAKKDGEAAAASIEPPVPSVDWSDFALRRQAASCLVLHGDLKGALEILPADDPDRGALEQVTAAGHTTLLLALRQILPEEERRLLTLLERAGKETVPPRKNAGPSTALIRTWGRLLPEGTFFRFMVDLHCRLRDRTRASDAHVKLLLESCFHPTSAGRRLFRESKTLRPSPDRTVPEVGAQDNG